MVDADEKALAWVGQRAQRVMALTGVPFVVIGVLSVVPAYVLLREGSFWLMGVNHPGLSALIACLPCGGLIAAGRVVSERIRKWSLPGLARQAAERFNADETLLREMFL